MANQVLYRIYTEDRQDYRERIIHSLKSRGIPDFTVAPAIGYGPGQDGQEEKTAVIEVVTDDGPNKMGAIRRVVGDIQRNNSQQSVLVMAIPVAYALVESAREDQLQLPIEGIVKPRRKQEDGYVRKPWKVAYCGKWQILMKAVEPSIGKI